MATKIEKIVFEHPSMSYETQRYLPLLALDQFKGNLAEMKIDVAYNSDTAPMQGADMPRFLVKDVEMPSWMSVEYYIKHETFCMEIFYAFGIDLDEFLVKKWEAIWNGYSGEVFDGIIKLLKTNLRSEFRIGLKNQVQAWFDNPNPKFELPLSQKQAQCVMPFKPFNRNRF